MTDPHQPPAPPPLKPHRKLFIIMAVVVALWVAVLISLYVFTVYPLRYPDNASPEAGTGLLLDGAGTKVDRNPITPA